MSVVILPDNMDEMIENANKPPLAPGKYLAVITGGEAKLSENGKNSFGIFWDLLINNNPDAFDDGWDSEAGTTQNKMYTYMGKVENGRLDSSKASRIFTKLMGILGVRGGQLDTDQQKFRQIGVIVEHVPSKEDREALETNPAHEVAQYYIGIKTVLEYKIGDEVCPKLAYLADSVEEPEDLEDAPVEETVAKSEAPAETTKKKRGAKTEKPAEGDDQSAW